MQKFLNTLWEFSGEKEDKDNFIQKALKVKPLKTPKPDVPSKKTAYNLFCKDIRRIKKGLQGVVFLSPRQVQSYQRNGKRLKPVRRKWKSTKTFMKKRNNNMKRHCKDIKKIIRTKWRSLTFTKSVTRRLGKFHRKKYHPNQMNLKKYRWKKDRYKGRKKS